MQTYRWEPFPILPHFRPRYDVMGLIIFILAARFGYLYALKYVRHLNR